VYYYELSDCWILQNMNLFKLIYCFFIVIIPILATAQEGEEPYLQETIEQRDFDKNQWEQATKDLKYVTEKEQRTKEQKADGRGKEPFSFKFGGNASFTMKIIIGLLLAVLLFFVLRSLLGLNNPRDKKINEILSVEELTQLEENLHQANLDDFIRRAIEQGNYALAVRLYYLAILKELSLQERIEWKRDKTNRDYLREMRSSTVFNDFSDVTTIFERIWYGNIALSRLDFERIEPKFKTLIHSIKASTNPIVK